MLWFAIFLPNLPLQVFQRGTPEAQPLAVVERRRCVGANPAAQRLGVHAGLGEAAAAAMAETLVTRVRDPALEEAALRELACWAGRYSPVVSLDAPACVLIEVGAGLRLFGGAQALAAAIRAGCRELGFAARLAGAPTPLAARWLARAGTDAIIMEAAGLEQALDPLPLDVLECPPQVLEMLLSIGMLTLGECRRLPRRGLARRGAGGVIEDIDRALGALPDPRPGFVAPSTYAARLELGVHEAQTEALAFALARLLAGFSAWLEARQAGVGRFRVRLMHEGREATLLTVTLGSASRDCARCTRLAREHLARIGLAAPVCALALEAGEIVPLAARSRELFAQEREPCEDIPEILERLRARLGEDAVWTPQCVADHRPERAWRRALPGRAPVAAAGCAPARPLWLLIHPERLAGRDDRPDAPLRLLRGPERIESGWWENGDAGIRRDYFIAAGGAGELLWVYRDLEAPGAWVLHGIFA